MKYLNVSKIVRHCHCFSKRTVFIRFFSFKFDNVTARDFSEIKRKLNCKFLNTDSKSVAFSKKSKQDAKKISKQNEYCYIKEIKDAESIASYLCKGWNSGYILEANPGPGFLSKAILNEGITHVRVFEKNEDNIALMKELSVSYPNLEIITENLLLLPSLESRVSENEPNICDSFFTEIPEYSWEEGIPCRIFATIFNKKSIKFLRFLLAVLPTKSSLFSLGRCEFFLLLPESEYLYITAEPKENFSSYRWTTVLYNLFFEIKFLHKYSSDILYPLPTRGKKKVSKDDHFYLVQVTPKPDLFSYVVHRNKLPEFYFFVRHHLMKRTGLVIPTMESWIPSCGPRLIKEGMNVFTKFGDLSPKQILLLFNQFSSWPEYEDSSFCAALQRYYGKRSLSFDEEETI